MLGRLLGRRSLDWLGIPNGWTAGQPAHVAQFARGVTSRDGATLDGRGRLVFEWSEQWQMKQPLEHHLFRRPRIFPPILHAAGTLLSLSAQSSTNLFHWLYDVLPRLELARQAGMEWDQVYLDQQTAVQRETAALLGLEQVIAADRHPLVRADRLLVPPWPAYHAWPEPWQVDFLRRSFPLQRQKKRRLYVSRADATRRRVLNEEELRPLLSARGFDLVTLAGRSFCDQAQLFADAEIVISVHGAGLAHLAFCQPGTRVIELFAPRFHFPCYEELCRAADLSYQSLDGKKEEGLASQPLFDDLLLETATLLAAVDFEHVEA